MPVKWEKSKYPGVRFYKHPTRKHGTNFDRYYTIRYQAGGKRIEEGLGWWSEGWTEKKAYDTLSELKEAAKTGKGAASLKDRRKQKAMEDEAMPTFSEAVEKFMMHCERTRRAKTVRYYRDGLAKAEVFQPGKGTGKLGEWKLSEIHRRNLAALIEEIGTESQSVAIQVRSSLSSLYAWAIQSPREYVETNIVRDVPRPEKPAPRERTLSIDEAAKLLAALETAEGDPAMIRLVRFILLTGCRLSEASHLQFCEIDGEWWEVPAARFKGKRAHRVYLTEEAAAQIDPDTDPPFASIRTGRPFEPSSVGRWLKRNDYFGLDPFSVHDLRRTVGSGLAKLGFSMEVIAATLGHKLQGVTAEHYIRHRYDDEKKKALTVWAKHLIKHATGKKDSADVIPLSSKRA